MTTDRFPDKTAIPPGYYDKPEFVCINHGLLYRDEVKDDRCILCGAYVGEGEDNEIL